MLEKKAFNGLDKGLFHSCVSINDFDFKYSLSCFSSWLVYLTCKSFSIIHQIWWISDGTHMIRTLNGKNVSFFLSMKQNSCSPCTVTTLIVPAQLTAPVTAPIHLTIHVSIMCNNEWRRRCGACLYDRRFSNDPVFKWFHFRISLILLTVDIALLFLQLNFGVHDVTIN